ncbi:hypothetical protein WG66_007782 [Moniliophthora roreri]|uniref:C2H2-type domain-containing protein n=1 Tax=Moniliophthora roreri TaxID=221103 RepID=A0A0W0EZW4_MONRR|nr:hypothetical protein WG66_007782 [Moniliophthora roreri]
MFWQNPSHDFSMDIMDHSSKLPSPNPMPNACLYQDDISQDMNRIASFERSFCSSFFCCDVQLSGFHELLEHIEEVHLVLLNQDGKPLYHPKVGPLTDKNAEYSKSKTRTHAQFGLTFPFPPTPTPPATCRLPVAVAFHEYHDSGMAEYGDDDRGYDERGSLERRKSFPASTTPSPASTPRDVPPSSDSDMSSDEESPLPSPISPSPTRPIPIISMGEMTEETSYQHEEIVPNISRYKSVAHAPKANRRWKNVSHRERVHKCPTPGCTKSYLNPNGLKYHRDKGRCIIDSETAFMRSLPTKRRLAYAHVSPPSPASTSPPTP